MMRMKVPKLRIHTSPEACLISIQLLDKQLQTQELNQHQMGQIHITRIEQKESNIQRPIPPPRPSLLRKRLQLQTGTDLNATIYQNDSLSFHSDRNPN